MKRTTCYLPMYHPCTRLPTGRAICRSVYPVTRTCIYTHACMQADKHAHAQAFACVRAHAHTYHTLRVVNSSPSLSPSLSASLSLSLSPSLSLPLPPSLPRSLPPSLARSLALSLGADLCTCLYACGCLFVRRPSGVMSGMNTLNRPRWSIARRCFLITIAQVRAQASAASVLTACCPKGCKCSRLVAILMI